MSRQKSLIFFVSVVSVMGLFYWFNQNKDEAMNGTRVVDLGQDVKRLPHSNFVFETVKNKKIEIDVADKIFKIKGMEEKTVFLKVFGWNCKFCNKEIPQLINLKDELGDAFEVVAIEAQHASKEESLQYIEEYGINYPIISGEPPLEFYAYLQKKYGWTGIIPLTIVIGKGGNVLAFEIGEKSYSLAELMKASLTRG